MRRFIGTLLIGSLLLSPLISQAELEPVRTRQDTFISRIVFVRNFHRSVTVSSDSDELTKVLVDLPNHWATSGESMWARPLGNDLYELHNSPFHAYGLNYLDVVLAISEDPNRKPIVRRVERRSGHRTLRILFTKHVSNPQRDILLKGLDRFGVTWEGSEGRLFSLDIPDDSQYQPVCDQLWAWEQAALLEYETCEARMPGSFDDRPGEQ